MVCGVLRATCLSSSKAEPGGFPSICINSCQTQEEDSIPINSLGPLQKQRPLCEVDTVLPGGVGILVWLGKDLGGHGLSHGTRYRVPLSKQEKQRHVGLKARKKKKSCVKPASQLWVASLVFGFPQVQTVWERRKSKISATHKNPSYLVIKM